MTKIDDGGPAFPSRTSSGITNKGMSLRDHYAGLALQGYMVMLKTKEGITPDMQDQIAEGMFSMADAMLQARARPAWVEEDKDPGGKA